MNWRQELLNRFRKYRFCRQVRVAGGTSKIGQNIHFTHPVYFQGKGSITLNDNIVLGYWLSGAISLPILLQPREPESKIKIGSSTAISNGCEIIARTAITIGENCRIGAKTTILDADFHGIQPDQRSTPGITEPVEIQDNVWIGYDALILKGVCIGKDAIVGARCVVTKDVHPGAIVAGNPMRVIGSVYA